MVRDVDLGKLRKWIGKAQSADAPPKPQSQRLGSEEIVQLNLKVPASVKRRMKHLAARDDVNLTTLLARMVDEYELAHGELPSIER